MTALTLSGLTGCMVSENASEQAHLGGLTEAVALPPPTLLSVTSITPTAQTITWSTVTNPDLNLYIVDVGTTPDNLDSLTTVSALNTVWTSTNLMANTEYCWGVRDVTTANEISPRSNVLCTTTPAVSTTPPPADVRASAISDARITLAWDPVPGATTYHVFFQVDGTDTFNPLTSVAAPTVSTVAANLAATTTYNFVVTALAPSGESTPSPVASATTFPAGLEGYWQFDERTGPSSLDISGYARDATLSGATFSTDRPPVDLLSNKSTLSISADPSSQATVLSQPTFRFAGSTFALSMWVKLATAVDTDIVGVRAASCGALGWKLTQDATNRLNVSGGGGIRSFGTSLEVGTWTHVAFSYDATTAQLVMYVNGSQVASSSYSPRNGLADAPLTIGHVGGCTGGAVLVDELRIFSRTLSAPEVDVLGRVPPAPTLTVTAPSPVTETLTWTAVAGASRYFVYRGMAAGAEAFFASVASSSLSFMAQQLSPLTRYSWFVRAELGGLDSPNSNEVVLSTPDLLPAPTNVVTTVQPPEGVAVSWAAVIGATEYQVLQSSSGGAFARALSVDATATSAVVANLVSGVAYRFEVAAVDATHTLGHVSVPSSVNLP